MTLLGFLFLAMCGVAVIGFAAFALKLTLKLVLLPVKLLLLPIIAIVLVVKFAILLAIGAIILAILIPLAVLFVIFVGPFLLLGSLT